MQAPELPAKETLRSAGYPDWLASLLARRGVLSPEEAHSFLHPSIDQLHSPQALHGMQAAVTRLLEARRNGERVALIGDYDVDGISGTALLLAVLRTRGVEAEAIIPHRKKDGYGFQTVHVDLAISRGCRLVVTVDCGTTSVTAASAALSHGVDVVITDHHLPGKGLPPGILQINPRQSGCNYPFEDLSGAGIAMKLALAFADACAQPVDPRLLLRIACLGTIADLVPLLGENRVIAKIGLQELERTTSLGLQALIEVSKIKPPFTAEDVGYRLGPRLNAPGRLDSADQALELILSRDQGQARRLAADLDAANRERQSWEKRVSEEAAALFELQEDSPILVGWSSNWHRGVVGISAGRLAKEWNRPVLLFAIEGEDAVGSGRSAAGVHLHEFLSQWSDRLPRFGGHAQAIGMTVRSADLPGWNKIWREAATWTDKVRVKKIEYEVDLPAQSLNAKTFEQLQSLEPFGQANPRPLIRTSQGLRLIGAPRVFGNGHISAIAQSLDGRSRIKIVGWNWQSKLTLLQGTFEALGNLELDRYSGEIVFRLVDARAAQSTLSDSHGPRTDG